MARSRERGTGSVYLKEDPNNPGQKLQTWWISYYIDGKRKRESSKSRKKSDAQALLKRRMGQHALGLELGDEAKRLTFEDLEAGFRRSYENSGRRSLRRAGNAWDRLREHFSGWKARTITIGQYPNGSSGFEFLGLGFRDTCFDGDLHSILHRIFNGHLDSEQAVLVGRFGFVRFYLPC